MSRGGRGVVAAGQTDHVSRRFDVGIAELVREAIDRCLETRDLTSTTSMRSCSGTWRCSRASTWSTTCSPTRSASLGKPLWKLNNGGTVGSSTAVAAYHLVAGGCHRRVLGVGFEKQSEGSTQSAITTVGDPVWERAVMAGAIGNFAAMASTYVYDEQAPRPSRRPRSPSRRGATRCATRTRT